MKRALSRVADGQLIEYAGGSTPRIGDAEQRERLQNAPEWWRRSFDKMRQSRDLPPLFEKRKAPAASVPVRKKPPKAYTLVGCVTPGTSSPVAAATDGLTIPERFEPRAFRRSLEALANRETFVDLLDGHSGPVIASTADLTLSLAADPVVGLIAAATVPTERRNYGLFAEVASGTVGFSVGYRLLRASVARVNGRRVRIVHEGEIDHIAIIRGRHGGTPSYRSRLRLLPSGVDARVARLRAVLDGLNVICSQEGLS